MVTIEDIEKYELYLKFMDRQLAKFFQEQSPYIFCKEGCCSCCQNGEYPVSAVEFSYMLIGSKMLSLELVAQIEQNIFKVKEEKDNYQGEDIFRYACPFLLNNRCSIYNNRPIICRTHGLAYFSAKGKLLVPACVNEGLNYSNVYDFDLNSISVEKFKELGVEQEPLAHNVGLSFMSNNDLTEKLELDFGEFKPMYKWFFPE